MQGLFERCWSRHRERQEQIHKAIDSSLQEGLRLCRQLDLAYKMAWSSFEEGAKNWVVVLFTEMQCGKNWLATNASADKGLC